MDYKPPLYYRGRTGKWYKHAPDLKMCGYKDAHIYSFYSEREGRIVHHLIENDPDAQWMTTGIFYELTDPMLNACLESEYQRKSVNADEVFKLAQRIIQNGSFGVAD